MFTVDVKQQCNNNNKSIKNIYAVISLFYALQLKYCPGSFPDNSSYSLRPIELNLGVYSKTMRWDSAYYLEVAVQ